MEPFADLVSLIIKEESFQGSVDVPFLPEKYKGQNVCKSVHDTLIFMQN